MRKIRWLLAALGVALVSLVPVLGASAPAGADPGTILKFTTMTPVTGPYVGAANPIRTVPGGGVPRRSDGLAGELKGDGVLDRAGGAAEGLPGAEDLPGVLDRDFD